jgi:hypothetical protein
MGGLDSSGKLETDPQRIRPVVSGAFIARP